MSDPVSQVLRTPSQWCRHLGLRILDPDGWRSPDAKDWNEPITEEEFQRRFRQSTIKIFHPGIRGVRGVGAASLTPERIMPHTHQPGVSTDESWMRDHLVLAHGLGLGVAENLNLPFEVHSFDHPEGVL